MKKYKITPYGAKIMQLPANTEIQSTSKTLVPNPRYWHPIDNTIEDIHQTLIELEENYYVSAWQAAKGTSAEEGSNEDQACRAADDCMRGVIEEVIKAYKNLKK